MLYELARRQSVVAIVLTPVLTEVWRGGARQARLSIALRGCEILAPDERLAKVAGVLLANPAPTIRSTLWWPPSGRI